MGSFFPHKHTELKKQNFGSKPVFKDLDHLSCVPREEIIQLVQGHTMTKLGSVLRSPEFQASALSITPAHLKKSIQMPLWVVLHPGVLLC